MKPPAYTPYTFALVTMLLSADARQVPTGRPASCDFREFSRLSDPRSFVRYNACLALERDATASEISGGTRRLASAARRMDFLLDSMDSAEFQSRYGASTLSHQQFLELVYTRLLSRAPTVNEVTSLVPLLEAGATRRATVAAVLASDAFRSAHPIYYLITCNALKALNGRDEDAGPAIRACIQPARAGEVVELPPGKYRISTRVLFERGYTVRTQGKTPDMPKCAFTDAHDCAELIATPTLESAIFGLTGIGGAIDHLVINGNKSERKAVLGAKGCTFPMRNGGLDCTECTMTNSVSKNAFCGTGLQLGVDGNNLLISRNTFAFNGVHTSDGIWADGLTALQIHNSSIVDNDFIDNTDVDLVMGGCPDCRVRNNRIVHTNDPQGASFAALIVHAWPANSTSGNYTGADISNNSIDCGIAKHCGFGLLVGGDPWYQAPTFGGSIHDNRIRNAMQGVNVDHTTGVVEFYDNFVERSGGEVVVACGNRMTTTYNIAPDSVLDRSRDSIPTSAYSRQDWDGCVISPTIGRSDNRRKH